MSMKLSFILVCFLWPALAFAQQSTAPLVIDRDLWNAMATGFGSLSMPFPTHQQIQQIMQNVEKEAVMRNIKNKSDKESVDAKQKPSASPLDGGSGPQP